MNYLLVTNSHTGILNKEKNKCINISKIYFFYFIIILLFHHLFLYFFIVAI